MTYREKLAIEHPEKIHSEAIGGCLGCPVDYGYADNRPAYCSMNGSAIITSRQKLCSKCWDEEIPEEKSPTRNLYYEQLEKESGPHILDSGERREFESGAVRDIQEGKGRCDLMPLDVVAFLLDHETDSVIDRISRFQETGNLDWLYTVLFDFAECFDDGKTKESMRAINTQRLTTMFLEVSKHFEEGAKKYGEYNWQKGIPVHCYIDSAVRHYLKFLRGDKDEPHDRAFGWNLMCCIWTCKHKPELNSYAKKGE